MVPELLPSKRLTSLAPDQTETSDSISMVEVTNQEIHPAVKHEPSVGKSAPVQYISDKTGSSSTLQIHTDGCLVELSESETRSVYNVTSKSLIPELGDRPEVKGCDLEMLEQQTSDKHTSETALNEAPETSRLPSASPKSHFYYEEQDTFQSPIKNKAIGVSTLLVPVELNLHEFHDSMSGADSISNTSPRPLFHPQSVSKAGHPDQHSTPADIKNNLDATEANPLPESEKIISSAEVPQNKKDDQTTYAQVSSFQQNADTCTGLQLLNPVEDLGPSSTHTPAKQTKQPNNTEKQITTTDPSQCDDSMKYRSSSELTTSSTNVVMQSGSENRVSKLSSDFHELLTSLHSPVFSRPRPQNRGNFSFLVI